MVMPSFANMLMLLNSLIPSSVSSPITEAPEALKFGDPPGSCVPPSTIVNVSGSSSSVPVCPLGALVFTEPAKSRLCLPEISTKPPSPDCVPPRAVTVP